MAPRATASLFYGIFVRLRSLVCAAHALCSGPWTVDWILRLRRTGTLQVAPGAGRTTVADLPDELWDMIRAQLLLYVYDDAVAEFGVEHERGRVRGYSDESLESPVTLSHLDGCNQCWEGAETEFADLSGLLDRHRIAIKALLASFELGLAPPETIHDPENDFYSASCAVSIPLATNRRGGQPAPTSVTLHEYHSALLRGGLDDTMVLDAELFTAQQDSREPFKRLLSAFPKLEIRPSNFDCIYLPGQRGPHPVEDAAGPASWIPAWHVWAVISDDKDDY